MNEPSRENENPTNTSIPPPLPQRPVAPSIRTTGGQAASRNGQAASLFHSFSRDFSPMDRPLTMLGIVDALLKRPARVTHEVVQGRSGVVIALLLVITILCLLAYGFIMGTFSGADQLWRVPLKLAAGVLLSALICLPSLYIFASLSGGRQSFRETAGLLLQCLSLAGILLVGFAPIVWIFSQATDTTVFMGVLHLVFWIVSLWLCLNLLTAAFNHLNNGGMSILPFWGLIFLIVTLQMSTTLRPLIGKDDGVLLKEKKFFVAHWTDCFEHPKP